MAKHEISIYKVMENMKNITKRKCFICDEYFQIGELVSIDRENKSIYHSKHLGRYSVFEIFRS